MRRKVYHHSGAQLREIQQVPTVVEGKLEEDGKWYWCASKVEGTGKYGYSLSCLDRWRIVCLWLSRERKPRKIGFIRQVVREEGRPDMRWEFLYLEDDLDEIAKAIKAGKNDPDNPWPSTEESAKHGFSQSQLKRLKRKKKLRPKDGIRIDSNDRWAAVVEWNPEDLKRIKKQRTRRTERKLKKKNQVKRPPKEPTIYRSRYAIPTAWITARYPKATEQGLSYLANRSNHIPAVGKEREAPPLHRYQIKGWSHWDFDEFKEYCRYRIRIGGAASDWPIPNFGEQSGEMIDPPPPAKPTKNIQPFLPLHVQDQNSQQKKAKQSHKRGPKGPRTNPDEDQRLWDAWHTGQYENYEALGREKDMSAGQVEKALDRVRKRSKSKSAKSKSASE
jgi:hypothetical protein